MVRRKADGGPDDRYPLIGKAGFGGHAAGASVRALHRFGLQSQAQHLSDLFVAYSARLAAEWCVSLAPDALLRITFAPFAR